MTDVGTPARRRFGVACLVGGLLGVVAFVVVLHASPGGFFRRETLGNVFDAQTDAWLHGRWNVSPGDLYIEGFRIGGKTFTYFGAWPSILRIPVLAVSGSPYGHLSALSMTIAFAVALTGVAMLQWRLRELFRPGRPVGPGECVLAAAVVLVAGCGTTLLFLGSRAWVYHEAILWGAAWALVAYERIIAFMLRPTRGRLTAAALFAALAFLSRASVGLGPLVTLGLILAGRLLRMARRWWSARRDAASGDAHGTGTVGHRPWLDWLSGRDDGRSWVGPLFLAVFVPAIVYVYVNFARFDTPLSVPWSRQVLALVNPRHEQVLAANGGTYFGLKFAPTTLLQYLRPDGLALDPHFPWVTFPRFGTRVIGNAKFDTLDPSTSVVASMPALVLLAGFGIVAALRTGYGRTRDAAALRVPLLGALAGLGLTVAISYVAQRYLGDWVPLLVLGALIGLQALLRRRDEPEHRRAATAWIAVAAVLAVFGIWVNGGLALVYARLYKPQHDTDRLAMLTLQHDLDVGGPHSLGHSARLPARPASAGTTWVVGDCDAVYWSDGRSWSPVQGRAASGWFRLRVRPSDLSSGWRTLVTDGRPGAGVGVEMRRTRNSGASGGADLRVGAIGRNGRVVASAFPVALPFGPGEHRVTIVLDHALRSVRVSVDGTDAVQVRGTRSPIRDGPFRLGPGVRRLPDSIGLCRDLVGNQLGGAGSSS